MDKGWYLVELMGHRRITGECSEEVVAGQAMLRVDIPGRPPLTQFYSGGSIYALTPITEAVAREFAAEHVVQPISPWDLPGRPAALSAGGFDRPDAHLDGLQAEAELDDTDGDEDGVGGVWEP